MSETSNNSLYQIIFHYMSVKHFLIFFIFETWAPSWTTMIVPYNQFYYRHNGAMSNILLSDMIYQDTTCHKRPLEM